MSVVYTAHLNQLNKESNESNESTEELCAICPIMHTGIDALDISSTVSVIRDTRSANIQEHENIIQLAYPQPTIGEFEIHMVDVFEINAAKFWFCDKNGVHPVSRNDISPVAKSRIKMRFDFQEYFKIIPSVNSIINAFNEYLYLLVQNKVDLTSDIIMMLRCHLKPEDMMNFFYMTREQAYIRILKTQQDRSGPTWIIRPSRFKGYKFALNHDGKFYPMTEYFAITYMNEIKGEFGSELIEKVFSCGYYKGHGVYVNDSLNYVRTKGYPCFFDVLHTILMPLHKKSICDITNIAINEDDNIWKTPQLIAPLISNVLDQESNNVPNDTVNNISNNTFAYYSVEDI